jgi:LacI family transcriptional regulator
MRRPTIPDLAKAAGLSVATVNRVLAGAGGVRLATQERVRQAAGEIGFYGLGAIEKRVAAARPHLRLGVLLLQPHRPFYQNIASALRAALAEIASAEIDLRIEFLEDLSPQTTAERALALAEQCQAIALVSAEHPVVNAAIAQIQARGVTVFALVAPLSSSGKVPYVGLDNWRLGRMGAWALAHLRGAPGPIGLLVGNPRYRNQELSEAGLRSYFREYGGGFTLLEPLSTFETADVAQEITTRLLAREPDLACLYVNGGGVTGAIAALRESGRAGKVRVVGHDLTDVTRSALIDGTMAMVLSHPLRLLAVELLRVVVRAALSEGEPLNLTRIVAFEVYTSENI